MRPILLALCWALIAVLPPLAAGQSAANGPVAYQARVVDTLDAPEGWKVITSDAVTLRVTREAGAEGGCLRLDYHFTTGAGYCIIQKAIAVEVPGNYEFAYRVRGEGPANNLEFKLLDESGENVWWQVRRGFEWPREWTRLVSKKRDIEFAWGPLAGAALTRVARVEFAVSSSSGGSGTVWLDELTFRELPPARLGPPKLSIHDPVEGQSAAIDNDPTTAWAATAADSITIDQGEPAEFGAVEIKWKYAPRLFRLEISDDGAAWTSLTQNRAPGVATTVVPTPNAQGRFVRMTFEREFRVPTCISEIRLLPAEFSASPNAMMSALAKERPRGRLPRQFLGEQSYWTVVGAEGSACEALINEEGQIEVGKRLFSVEPFVRVNGRLLTWAEGRHTQSLREGYLPVPTVTREHDGLTLSVTPFVDGDEKRSVLYARYAFKNTGTAPLNATLDLCVRPFQVNPAWQRLNFEGGVSPIREIATGSHGLLIVNRAQRIVALSDGAEASASSFAQGDIVEWLAAGRLPGEGRVVCPDGLASGVISFTLMLAPGKERWVDVAVPLQGEFPEAAPGDAAEHLASEALERVVTHWIEQLHGSTIAVPKADTWLADTFKAQLAYILINRDGPAIQPGSRSYERSWARDGSLTSAALLTLGHPEEVRAWIDWYGEHLFENGKVPCVVDARGPDPVPENDSHGEYIWAVARYYRFTGDRAFLERHWPRVRKVVGYIRSLRAQRETDEYRTEEWPGGACYGLVPESISHEGYSAKPMHSYWDDFFVLLGLREAAWLAEQVGGRGSDDWQACSGEYESFRVCLIRSITAAQAHHKIDYIPGCVELGDFDATSTTVALFPCEADFAEAGLSATFDRYWDFAEQRMRAGAEWEAYTPYEWRAVGAFVRLGRSDRAYRLMQWFRTHQRPAGWRHWAEVVFREPLTPRFIGDMPHTWVGSDFLNSVVSMFVYDHDDTLVLFAGVPREWIDSGERVAFENLRTPYGPVSASLQRVGREVRVRVDGGFRVPAGGVSIRLPVPVLEPAEARMTFPMEAVFHLRDGEVPGPKEP